jgi:hypothetical protein
MKANYFNGYDLFLWDEIRINIITLDNKQNKFMITKQTLFFSFRDKELTWFRYKCKKHKTSHLQMKSEFAMIFQV